MPWHQTAPAQTALASIATRPPAPELRTSTFNHARGRYDETDPRVIALWREYRRYARQPGFDVDSEDGKAWLRFDPDQAIDEVAASGARRAA